MSDSMGWLCEAQGLQVLRGQLKGELAEAGDY